jgi:hypothetical protein
LSFGSINVRPIEPELSLTRVAQRALEAPSTMKSISTTVSFPSTYVRDREQLDLIGELDGVYDHLLAEALNGGGDGVYQLAASVKAAADYLINLRLSAAR